MDGYIKNKREKIAAVRKLIGYKYAVSFLIVIFIPVWLFAMVANQAPQKWKHTEIVFSHISYEHIGLRRWRDHVLNTQEGRKFVIQPKYVSIEELKNDLVPGKAYSLTYSHSIAGGDHIEALLGDERCFQDLDKSIAQWEREQQEMVIALAITLGLELIVLILIDRLWCKEEHAQIKKLKKDIANREARRKNA